MLKNIIDGWLYNPAILYLPYRFVPMALGQAETLRRAHNYRPRIWVLPEDLSITIPARDQYQREIEVTPGAYLWGASFYKFTPPSEDRERPQFIAGVPTDLSLQLTDVGSGVELASEFIPAKSFWPGTAPETMPVQLAQPKLILAPGLVSVQIANTGADVAYAQLVLYFAEPCEPRELEGDSCV